jgi:putative chitinase
MITKEILLKIMPNAKNVDIILPFLLEGFKIYNINTKLRENHFLAQVAHESGEFRYLKELASGVAYEGRKDLGNIYPGDGVRHKGRGLIQITGRANYAAISKDLGVDFIKDPVLLESPHYAALSACWFWNSRNLNKYADLDDFLKITKLINGGTNGLDDRKKYLDRAKLYNV